jgi:hypothetical protein
MLGATNMDISTFSQLGIGLSTLVILWIVVKYFIEALTKKDDYIQTIVKEFNVTINNHIDHSTQAQKEMTRTLESLVKAIDRLNAGVKMDRKYMKNRDNGA